MINDHPQWDPWWPPWPKKIGENGFRRDPGRMAGYFHVIPFAKMWEIMRGDDK